MNTSITILYTRISIDAAGRVVFAFVNKIQWQIEFVCGHWLRIDVEHCVCVCVCLCRRSNAKKGFELKWNSYVTSILSVFTFLLSLFSSRRFSFSLFHARMRPLTLWPYGGHEPFSLSFCGTGTRHFIFACRFESVCACVRKINSRGIFN